MILSKKGYLDITSDRLTGLQTTNTESPQLSKMKKEAGRNEATKAICIPILQVMRLMTGEENKVLAVEYAAMILSEFWDLRIDDVLIAFKKGVSGGYEDGKVFGKLTYMNLASWLQSRRAEKQIAYEDMHEASRVQDDTERRADMDKRLNREASISHILGDDKSSEE